MKCVPEGDQELYNDDELDIGYESEAMFIEPEVYVRFPLPKGTPRSTRSHGISPTSVVCSARGYNQYVQDGHEHSRTAFVVRSIESPTEHAVGVVVNEYVEQVEADADEQQDLPVHGANPFYPTGEHQSPAVVCEQWLDDYAASELGEHEHHRARVIGRAVTSHQARRDAFERQPARSTGDRQQRLVDIRRFQSPGRHSEHSTATLVVHVLLEHGQRQQTPVDAAELVGIGAAVAARDTVARHVLAVDCEQRHERLDAKLGLHLRQRQSLFARATHTEAMQASVRTGHRTSRRGPSGLRSDQEEETRDQGSREGNTIEPNRFSTSARPRLSRVDVR